VHAVLAAKAHFPQTERPRSTPSIFAPPSFDSSTLRIVASLPNAGIAKTAVRASIQNVRISASPVV
jgi:hypothetical protein